MNEKDDLELFVQLLEAALVSLDITRDNWTRYLLAVEVKQKVIHLLQDRHASCDDIGAALMWSFAATAEALFSPIRGGSEQHNPRQIAD